jgi:hypothetical protein
MTMAKKHCFFLLPESDPRQTETSDRQVCLDCGILRSPRFGGGFVYSSGGKGAGDWTQTRPECVPRKQEVA